MEELGSIREMQIKESEASGKITGLEKKIDYSKIEKVTGIPIWSFIRYFQLPCLC